MTIRISLSSEAEARLREKAMAAGEDISAFAARVLDEALATRSVEELLRPFRQQVQESQMGDDELDAFYQGLREEAWNKPNSQGNRDLETDCGVRLHAVLACSRPAITNVWDLSTGG